MPYAHGQQITAATSWELGKGRRARFFLTGLKAELQERMLKSHVQMVQGFLQRSIESPWCTVLVAKNIKFPN